ncbi:uncharacterized protein RAG0_07161 [Rhynchosporium agropyri]|uniref:Uncharacterized protein n=1 Tax=Rhynchosporium agropyri TaxID=914238 RepID=A0A1E1KNB9_9HELO|nr:uncharacterized protein RAG0_07161 [Rhynchosporium agropyri]
MDDQQSTGLGGQAWLANFHINSLARYTVVVNSKSDPVTSSQSTRARTISLVHHQNSDIISTSNSDLGFALKSEDILHEFSLQLISVTLPPTSSAQWSLKNYEGSKYSIGHKDDQRRSLSQDPHLCCIPGVTVLQS